MADNQFRARFSVPVGKLQSTNPGELAEVGDTVPIQLVGWNAAGTERLTQNVVLTYISENGYEIGWEYDATSQYLRTEDIYSIAPGYAIECAVAGNISLTATDGVDATVTAFSINGVTTTETFLITEDGAADLEAAMQAAFDAAGIAGEVTVTWVDAATDYFKVYVTNTTATVIITPGGTLA